jgi:hypothetical protein
VRAYSALASPVTWYPSSVMTWMSLRLLVAMLLELWIGEVGFGRYCRTYALVVRPGLGHPVSTESEPKTGTTIGYIYAIVDRSDS